MYNVLQKSENDPDAGGKDMAAYKSISPLQDSCIFDTLSRNTSDTLGNITSQFAHSKLQAADWNSMQDNDDAILTPVGFACKSNKVF